MGTGTRDMIRLGREAGLREPEYAVRDGFVTTVWRAMQSATTRRTGKVTSPVAGEVAGEVAKLLQVCWRTMTRKELRESLLVRGDDNFRELYLVPALEAGWVEMTIPEKPNSRLQKYRLTPKAGPGWQPRPRRKHEFVSSFPPTLGQTQR